MKTKTLILGAAGFIGTNMTKRLLCEGKSLILFDRKEAVYQEIIRHAESEQKCRFVKGSFTHMKKEDWLELIPDFEEVETVYHLISTTCPTNSNRDVKQELEDNVISTIHLLDACVVAGVPKIVFLSSGGTVYGKEHRGLCKEIDETFPITVYGMQKLFIEKTLYLYKQMYGIDYRIIRLANPYGPYQNPNGVQGAVTTFLWRALHDEKITVYGDGSVVRDYIYIDDAVEGILKIANGNGGNVLYNLGSGKGHSLIDVIECLKTVLDKKLSVEFKEGRAADVPVNVLDISRFEQDFGKFTYLSLEEGIKRLLEFYLENKQR